MPQTITEALAEIKTIGKRIEKKRAGIMPFLARQDGVKDPHDKDGGSTQFIENERQSIADLSKRVIALRRGIQRANDVTEITVGELTMTISDWLTWRREVAPGQKAFLGQLAAQVAGARQQAQKMGAQVAAAGAATQPQDFIININEKELAAQIDTLEEILGTLDGQLSLKNATVMIDEA